MFLCRQILLRRGGVNDAGPVALFVNTYKLGVFESEIHDAFDVAGGFRPRFPVDLDRDEAEAGAHVERFAAKQHGFLMVGGFPGAEEEGGGTDGV